MDSTLLVKEVLMQMKLQSVEVFFLNERKTVEKYNRDAIIELGWECSDVLYSFRGIYSIGVFIYYRHLFIDDVKTDIFLKNNNGARQRLYSDKFLKEHYSEFKDVNNLPEIKMFLECYYDIGNVIPTWPGANVNRGMAHCYDIPNIYYKRHERFTKLIYGNIYKNAFLDNVLRNNEYDTVEKLFKLEKAEYAAFLKYVIGVIKERTNLLEGILQEDKKNE